MKLQPQLKLLKTQKSAYGGELRKTRTGRRSGRPLDTRNSMHMVLRSSKARGKWSFLFKGNQQKVRSIIYKFANKYGVQIFSIAVVGNHIHVHLKLGNRFTWRPFIRAVTAAIAMAITGTSRWDKNEKAEGFWDYRPYTRVVIGRRAYLSLKDYIEVNKWEGYGFARETSRTIVAVNKVGEAYWNSA